MTLKAKLEALWDNAKRTRHPGLTQAYEALIRNLSAVDITTQSLKAGDPMPHFLLPNVESRLVASHDLLEHGPLVVSFFRGEWCPFCTLELQALQKKLSEIEKLGANLVAITPDTGAALRAAKEKHRLPFQVLSDIDHALGLQFGIAIQRFYLDRGIDLPIRHGSSAWLLPMPATFVIDQKGKIRHAYVDVNFARRMEPDDIIKAVQAISIPD